MKFNAYDEIEYLFDVISPPSQAGKRGQVKTVDRDISIWAANYLLRGGYVRKYNPAKSLKLEDEERSKKKERSKKTNGQGATKHQRNKKEDNESS